MKTRIDGKGAPLPHLMVIVIIIALAGCSGSKATPTPSPNTTKNPASPFSQENSPSVTANSSISFATAATTLPIGADPVHGSGVTPFPYPTPGGASIYDSNGDGDLTWDEYKQAVAMAIQAFPWPPSYRVTPEIVVAGFEKDPINQTAFFQVGFELNNVGVFWNCAWFQTWLDARQSGDKLLEAQALEYIVNSLPQSVNDDYSRNFLKSIGDKALLGDPSGVIQVIKANNCAARLSSMHVATPKS